MEQRFWFELAHPFRSSTSMDSSRIDSPVKSLLLKNFGALESFKLAPSVCCHYVDAAILLFLLPQTVKPPAELFNCQIKMQTHWDSVADLPSWFLTGECWPVIQGSLHLKQSAVRAEGVPGAGRWWAGEGLWNVGLILSREASKLRGTHEHHLQTRCWVLSKIFSCPATRPGWDPAATWGRRLICRFLNIKNVSWWWNKWSSGAFVKIHANL